MKNIEELRNIHKGKEIWIIGLSPKLDNFPDNFFDDKISIALNKAFIAFPNCNYILFSDKREAQYIVTKAPQLLKKCIFMWPIEKHYRDDRIKAFQGNTKDLIYMNWARDQSSVESVLRKAFEDTIRKIVEGIPCPSISYATNSHNAVEAAVILGAKKITLVACEARLINFQYYARKRGLDKVNPSKDCREHSPEIQQSIHRSFRRMRLGLTWLAEILKNYGIEVRRYDYNKGYETI